MDKKLIPAIALIVIGFIFVLKNIFDINIFGTIDFSYIWPIGLIIFGIFKLFNIYNK